MNLETPTIPPQVNAANGHEFVAPPAPAAPLNRAEDTEAEQGHGVLGHKKFLRRDRPSPEPKPAREPKAPKEAKAKEPKPEADANDEDAKGFPVWAVILIVPFFTLFYAAFLSVATYGQGLMISSPKVAAMLPSDHTIELDLTNGLIIGGLIEFASIGLLIFSLIVRVQGERGTVPKLFSLVVAGIAIGMNSIGHLWLGDVIGAIIFTFCSLVAFITGTQMVDFFMRQIQRAKGMRVRPKPYYGTGLWWRDRDLVRRAGELFEADEKLDRNSSLALARQQREAERKAEARAEHVELMRELLFETANDEFGDERYAKLQVLADNPDETVEKLMAMGDSTEAAQKLWGRMHDQRQSVSNQRARRIAAELAAEYDPNSTTTATPNNGSKLSRIAGRIGIGTRPEFKPNNTPNGTPNADPNSTPNSGRMTAAGPVANEAEFDAESVATEADTAELPRVSGDEAKDRARAHIYKLIADNKPLPSGPAIEKEFGIGTVSSKGGIGNKLKKDVIEEYEKRMKEMQS